MAPSSNGITRQQWWMTMLLDLQEQIKELEHQGQKFETLTRTLIEENKNLKRQIEIRAEQYEDLENKMALQTEKIETMQQEQLEIQKDIQETVDWRFVTQQDGISKAFDEISASIEQIRNTTNFQQQQTDQIEIIQQQQVDMHKKQTAMEQQISMIEYFEQKTRSKIGEISSSIDEIKNDTKPVIAFRATCATNFPNDYTTKKTEAPVIWTNMEYNIGEAFDATTGIFTCPYDGIYSFYATSTIFGPQQAATIIYVNGSMKAKHQVRHISDVAHNELDTIAPSGVFQLNKGDTVHMYMGGVYYKANEHCVGTYFEGHLVDLL